jgi:hypothetical protein
MGTNYYARHGACKTCGHSDNEVHIGKSSGGWNFSLHVLPNLTTLDEWVGYWAEEGVEIFNEYDEKITPEGMFRIITQRSHPDGLIRHLVDGSHCVGQGEGSWDYIAGGFS